MSNDERGLYKWLSNVVRYLSCVFSSTVFNAPYSTNMVSVLFLAFRQHQRRLKNCPDVSVLFAKPSVHLLSLSFDLNLDIAVDGQFWDFTSDLAKGDTAYTTLALGAHTDNTYFVNILQPPPPPPSTD